MGWEYEAKFIIPIREFDISKILDVLKGSIAHIKATQSETSLGLKITENPPTTAQIMDVDQITISIDTSKIYVLSYYEKDQEVLKLICKTLANKYPVSDFAEIGDVLDLPRFCRHGSR